MIEPPQTYEFVVPREGQGTRLDRFAAQTLGLSRTELQRWIASGHVTVDGDRRPASTTLREGERVVVQALPPQPARALAEADVAFAILYVDDDIVILDKPAGLVVHPARGHQGGTLVNGLLARGLFQRDEWPAQAGESHGRPGIVHRLDKGTSGVMVVARTERARERLMAQFAERSIDRAYEAIVVGEACSRTIATLHGRHPKDRLRFTTRVLTGKRAVTHVHVLGRLAGATHVECKLETGRTHQIRVQLAETGTPVLGDPVYGRPPRDGHVRAVGEALGHQALHAKLLAITHPGSGARMRFEAPAPDDFAHAIRTLSQSAEA
ncbi:MAG: RluA family pseudouridine synthase [Polyangiaceae bacterium]